MPVQSVCASNPLTGRLFTDIITNMITFRVDEKNVNEHVLGVWQVREIARQDTSSSHSQNPLPSVFIFTEHHYSMMWLPSVESQKSFAERWSPTDEEKIERFNSLIVNAGTYEIKGSTLTAHPVVARIPDFVGGKLLCEFRIENDTMWLKFVDEYSFDGVQAPWVKSGGLTVILERID
jgi:hypothetical protein